MAAFQTLLGFGTGRKPSAYNEIRGAADLSRSNPKRLGLLKQPDKRELAIASLFSPFPWECLTFRAVSRFPASPHRT
jgi:hypothetical protein